MMFKAPFSTLVALICLMASPAMSAPLSAREYSIAHDIAARAVAASSQQGSEAFGIFSLIGDGLQGLGHLIESKTSSRRDLTARDYAIAYDLAARATSAPPQQGSEALGIFSLIGDGLEGLGHFVEDKTSNKKSRDLSDLFARKNTLYMEHGPAVYHTPTHASPRFDSYRAYHARELEELLARADDDGSAAIATLNVLSNINKWPTNRPASPAPINWSQA